MDRIREARERLGLNQKELSEILAISRPNLSRYENGEREPDRKTLLKISKVLNCSIDYLFENIDDPTPANEKKAPIQDEGLKFILEPDEEELLRAYRSLNDEGKEHILKTSAMAMKYDEYKKDNSIPDWKIG